MYLLFAMSAFQLFFSSLRLLLLLVGTAAEMAPPVSKTMFSVFAFGAVAAPIVHVRSPHGLSASIAHCRASD